MARKITQFAGDESIVRKTVRGMATGFPRYGPESELRKFPLRRHARALEVNRRPRISAMALRLPLERVGGGACCLLPKKLRNGDWIASSR